MSMDEFNETWLNYLCLNMDYNPIKSAIATDDIIINAIKYASGIRILRQDLWETIISFIISQNNNIPRIKKIIENMCRSFGTCLNDNDYLLSLIHISAVKPVPSIDRAQKSINLKQNTNTQITLKGRFDCCIVPRAAACIEAAAALAVANAVFKGM